MKARIYQNNYQITEMEQKILKAINHITYASKKGVTTSGIHRILQKKSTTNYDKASLGEIICKTQQNDKTNGKLKTVNPNYDEKSFLGEPFDIHPKILTINLIIQTNSHTASINTIDENSINNNYGNILCNKSFTDQPTTSEDPDKTVPNNEITIISVECYFIR